MRNKNYLLLPIAGLIALSLTVSGCAINFYKQNPRSQQKIEELERERAQFEEAKRMLEGKFQDQISKQQISLDVDDRGLVITLSDAILFDSGKAEVKKESSSILNNVASVIKKKMSGKEVGVGGHTDNVSIKHSSWKSNWELSTARATNVLHHLVKKGVSPEKLSATGYGKHRPVASNWSEEGRDKNRRVEIVVLPEFTKKAQAAKAKKEKKVKNEFIK